MLVQPLLRSPGRVLKVLEVEIAGFLREDVA